MRKMIFFTLCFMTSMTELKATTYTDHLTWVKVESGTSAPSCDVVRFRLQEYVKRSGEADHLFQWYSPVAHDFEQRRELLNVMRRMPFFLNDRLYEHLNVFHAWDVDAFELRRIEGSLKIRTAFSSSKIGWKDPYNGRFPDDVVVTTEIGRVQVKQKMSFERFCLEDTAISLRLETDSDSIILSGENDLGLLEGSITQ